MRAGRKSAAAFLVFLGAFASTHPVRAGDSPREGRSFWDLILPLGGPEDARDVGRAFDAAAGLAAPFKKFLFVSRYEPDLDKVLDLILLNSTSLDLDNLYSTTDIPWQADPDGASISSPSHSPPPKHSEGGGRKFFRFGGRIEPQDYHFFFTSNGAPLERFGDTRAEFSVQPVPSSRYKNVYAFAYQQSWFMGPLNTRVFNEINRTWLQLMDISEGSSAPDRVAADHRIRERFEASFPNFTREASGLIRVDSTVEPIPAPDGQGALTRLQVNVRFDDAALKRDFPRFRKAHQVLSASHLRMRVVDTQERDIYAFRAGGGSMGVTLVTRGGRIHPTSRVDGSPAASGEYLDEILSRPHHVEIENWIVMFGMKFGNDHLAFHVSRNEDRRKGVMAGVPRPILPPVIKQLFSPFIRSYYEVLYDGNAGQGMAFEGFFGAAESDPSASILTHRYEMPLQNSSLLSFFLKAGNRFRRSLPYEARVEFLAIVDRLSKALAADFDRARACYAAPGRLTVSAAPRISTEPAPPSTMTATANLSPDQPCGALTRPVSR